MHDTILLVFTGILAVAVLFQTIIFFGLYKSVRRLTEWMDGMGKDLLKDVEIISSTVDETLATIKEFGEGLKPIKERIGSTTEIIQKRVTELDSFLAEATDTARLEILRIRDRIESATDRTEEILKMMHSSILVPVSELNAIARGIKVGFDVLFRRRNPSRNTQDEEMFI